MLSPPGDGWEALLLGHGLGEGVRWALVSDEAPPEARWGAKAAHRETFACLFGHLVHRPSWLKRYLGHGTAQAKEAARAAAFLSLSRWRWACVSLEARLASERVGQLAARADELQARASRALHVEVPGGHLFEALEGDPAAVLAGAGVAAALGGELLQRFDEDFFRNPGFARWLEGAAAEGFAFPAPALDAAGRQLVDVLGA
jgi:hypothetical protein